MVSILVSAKNKLQELTAPCLEAVHRTVTTPFELIGIDDGSEDGTFDFMMAHCHKAIRLEGVGPGRARTAGMLYASGDYIMFLDNDVFPEKPGWLSQMVWDCHRGSAAILGPLLSNEPHLKALPRSADGLIDRHMIAGACFLFPRSTFLRLGKLDKKFSKRGEDTDYCFRAKLAGLRVAITPAVYLRHTGGGTFNWRKETGLLEAFRRKYRRYNHILPVP